LFGGEAATAEATAEATADGRRSPRMDPSDAGFSREVKLSPGGAAEIVNMSDSGLLVEGKTRLSTGAKVTVTLSGREQKRLSGRVVRCQVCAIHRDGTMTYQTAMALDQPTGIEDAAPAAPKAAPVVEAVDTRVQAAPVAPQVATKVAAQVTAPVPAPVAPRLVNQW
jgi:hypothetical protein